MNTRNKEQPSDKRQWREKSQAPVISRVMTSDEIEEHRLNLIASYQCENSDITTCFEKIQDAADEDRDDCLWLHYKMKCVVAGKPVDRIIFTIKLPIPDELKKMAEQMRQQRARRTNKPVPQLQAIAYEQTVEQPVEPEVVVTRPKLKRPIKKK
jgi:hypothetical protein